VLGIESRCPSQVLLQHPDAATPCPWLSRNPRWAPWRCWWRLPQREAAREGRGRRPFWNPAKPPIGIPIASDLPLPHDDCPHSLPLVRCLQPVICFLLISALHTLNSGVIRALCRGSTSSSGGLIRPGIEVAGRTECHSACVCHAAGGHRLLPFNFSPKATRGAVLSCHFSQ
jgi:hypothetical protein